MQPPTHKQGFNPSIGYNCQGFPPSSNLAVTICWQIAEIDNANALTSACIPQPQESMLSQECSLQVCFHVVPKYLASRLKCEAFRWKDIVTTVLHMTNRGEMWSLPMKRQSDNSTSHDKSWENMKLTDDKTKWQQYFTWKIVGKCEAYRWKDKVTTSHDKSWGNVKLTDEKTKWQQYFTWQIVGEMSLKD